VVVRQHAPPPGSFLPFIDPDPDQSWQPVSAELPDSQGTSTVYMYVLHSGMCLTRIRGAAGGTEIVQRPFDGTESQLWTLVPTPRPQSSADATFLTSLASVAGPSAAPPFGASLSVMNTGTQVWGTSGFLFPALPATAAVLLEDASGVTRIFSTANAAPVSCSPGGTATVTIPRPSIVLPPGRYRMSVQMAQPSGSGPVPFGIPSDAIEVTIVA